MTDTVRASRSSNKTRSQRPAKTYSKNKPNRPKVLEEEFEFDGWLEINPKGFGFVHKEVLADMSGGVYLHAHIIKEHDLRPGDLVKGLATRHVSEKETRVFVKEIKSINNMSLSKAAKRDKFEDLVPWFPQDQLRIERAGEPRALVGRFIDLFAPIGKGQRGLIVSPPKAGKTTVIKNIVKSIEKNNPEVNLFILLVDERPEEVTDMAELVSGAEVVSATFDRPARDHIRASEYVIQRAKRLVEYGEDVCIILDGITRLARAYNLGAPSTGRVMSGGVDSGALYPPKKFFGAARNIRGGGSLTILATALVDTGSKMDEVIYEEFKGTGNMEIHLSRDASERRMYPPINIKSSSTRREELLLDGSSLEAINKLRRALSGIDGQLGDLEFMIERFSDSDSNDELLQMAKT